MKVYRGTDVDSVLSNTPITWFTDSEAYAKTYAIAIKDQGYVFECELNTNKTLEVGGTDSRAYELYPFDPLVPTDELLSKLAPLNLTEDQVTEILNQVAVEHELAEAYRLTIWQVINSSVFAKLISDQGYDSVKAIEYDKINKTKVETIGVLSGDVIKVINKTIVSR